MKAIETTPWTATVTLNRYMGLGDGPPRGYNIYLSGELVISGISRTRANRVANLINAMTTRDDQTNEVRRVNTECTQDYI